MVLACSALRPSRLLTLRLACRYIEIKLCRRLIKQFQLGLKARKVREKILKAEGCATGSIIKNLQAKHLLLMSQGQGSGNEYRMRVLPPELKAKSGVAKNAPLHGGACVLLFPSRRMLLRCR